MTSVHVNENELHGLLHRVIMEMMKGIKHGHFELVVSGTANQNGSRNITLKSGLTHKYNMHINQIPKNIFPQVTFQPKAQFTSAQTSVTSAQDAHSDTEFNNGTETG